MKGFIDQLREEFAPIFEENEWLGTIGWEQVHDSYYNRFVVWTYPICIKLNGKLPQDESKEYAVADKVGKVLIRLGDEFFKQIGEGDVILSKTEFVFTCK